jgi:hypothetical protein
MYPAKADIKEGIGIVNMLIFVEYFLSLGCIERVENF